MAFTCVIWCITVHLSKYIKKTRAIEMAQWVKVSATQA